MNRPPSDTYQLLLDAEHADWLLEEYIQNGGAMYDTLWHARQAMAYRAWDRYYEAIGEGLDEESPCNAA